MPFEKELAELKERKEKALQMGGPKKIKIQHDKGKLTARERIPRLLDPDTFMEVGMLNCSDVPGMEDKTPADSKIGGYGKVDGRRPHAQHHGRQGVRLHSPALYPKPSTLFCIK